MSRSDIVLFYSLNRRKIIIWQHNHPASNLTPIHAVPENRFNPDGSETNMSLDRIFSEAPEDMDTLML